MDGICVDIYSQTASFRNPEFQNFHKTLAFPPPTTIIGMVGAALGLSPKMAQNFFEEHEIKSGIHVTSNGRTTDTWKYNKRTNHMHLYDPLLDGSVIKRELLIENRFLICFCSEDQEAISKIKTSFLSPFFALTMGNSDSVGKIKRIHPITQFTESQEVENCLVHGDILGEVIRQASDRFEFSIYQTSEPLTYDLPTRFEYQSDYGKRVVTETQPFSFVGSLMKLNFNLNGASVEEKFIPLFDL